MLFSSHDLFPSPARLLPAACGSWRGSGNTGCASAACAQVEAGRFVPKKKTSQHQAFLPQFPAVPELHLSFFALWRTG